MAQDPAYQPQPDPKNNRRRTAAEQGLSSKLAPDDVRAATPKDPKLKPALSKTVKLSGKPVSRD